MLGKSSIFMGHTVLNMNVVIKFRSSIVKIYSSDDIEYRSYIIPVSLSLSLSLNKWRPLRRWCSGDLKDLSIRVVVILFHC